jgi:hypothetical protein
LGVVLFIGVLLRLALCYEKGQNDRKQDRLP